MSDGLKYLMGYAGVLLIVLGGWIVFSYFEAKSYEEVTGKKVSLRQAMFLELRVLEPVK